MSLKNVVKSFPDGGREGFVAWLKSRSTITQEDSMSHHLGVDNIWRRLLGGFRIIGPIEFYESITRGLIRKFFGNFGAGWGEVGGDEGDD